jgi:hypothetical protein
VAKVIRQALDFMASLLWFSSWALFGALLFIASAALLPFILAAFICGRLSKHR